MAITVILTVIKETKNEGEIISHHAYSNFGIADLHWGR